MSAQPNCIKCIDQSDKNVLAPCKFVTNVGDFNGMDANFYSRLGLIICLINNQIYGANADRLCRKYQPILLDYDAK